MAPELYELFDEWKTNAGRNPAFVARGLHVPEKSDDAFDQHIRAMRLLAECQTAIAQLEGNGANVTSFRRNLRMWAATIMHYPNNWQAAGEAGRAFGPHAMDTLSSLAVVLDTRGPVVSEQGMERLRQLLRDVKDLLVEDDSISEDMRGHVYSVVQTLNRYLDDVEMYGQADIRDAIRDLWVSLNAAAGQSDERHRTKWEAFVRNVGMPAAGTILGSIPTLALETASLIAGG